MCCVAKFESLIDGCIILINVSINLNWLIWKNFNLKLGERNTKNIFTIKNL